MIKSLLSALTLIFSIGLYGQNIENSSFQKEIQPAKMCGFDHALEKMQQNDAQRYQEYVSMRQNDTETVPSNERSGTVYTIPVVFHILYNGASQNITDEQIYDAVAILNRDFRKLNSDISDIVSQFDPIASDAEIQFELATIAPNGQCFNGITRTNHSTTSTDGEVQVNVIVNNNDVYQGVWSHTKYLNIYVCRNLIAGAAGYTFLPQGSAVANQINMYYNGIFMLHDYVGSIGTSSIGTSRALTHEVGHWLNLSHVWGDGDIGECGTDYVSDTPQTNGSNGVCNLSKVTCDGNLDNVENYMDYSYCSKMFTAGQATRMRNSLTSTIAGRSSVWSTANLQSVGVLPGTSLCSARINASPTGLCQGTSTTFSVDNITSTITSYLWSFPGGTPATSTAANPTVTYNTVGDHDVTVTIVVGGNSRTITNTDYISVVAAAGTSALPIVEGFVGTTFPPANWSLTNGGNSEVWRRNTPAGTAPTAGNSARFDNYQVESPGAKDDLNSPAFSLENYSIAEITFDVAYRPYTGYSDKLEVLVSPGCGMDFEVVYSKAGTQLMTEAASTTTGYTSPTTWRNETIDLSSYVGNSQVQVKFRNTSGYSNYLYLDNINISGEEGTPNPSGEANFTASSTQTCVGNTVTYTNTSTGATSYVWNFGANASPATATGAGPHSVTYSASGSKTVTLSINGNTSTANQTVVVNEKPAPPVVSVVNNCGNSVISATGTSLLWSNGSSGNSITVANSNSVSVTQTVQGCVSNPASVSPAPKQNPNVTLSNIPALCDYDATITLTQGQPTGGSYLGQGVVSGTFNPSAVGIGTYTITYNYTAANGCSGSATRQVVVSGCLGVEENDGATFSVFPNPSNGLVNIVGSQAIQEVIVLDNMGRILEKMDVNNKEEVQLDLNGLAAGTYHIQTRMNELLKIVQIVKQ